MKVSVQFEDNKSYDCSFDDAQQLLRMGLAKVTSLFPLKLMLKQYHQPKKPDNDAGTPVYANGPQAPNESKDVILEAV